MTPVPYVGLLGSQTIGFLFINENSWPWFCYLYLCQEEHIPGALYFDIDHISDLNSNVRLAFWDVISHIFISTFLWIGTIYIEATVSGFIILSVFFFSGMPGSDRLKFNKKN